MHEANPQHVNALSSPCSAKPPETNDTTEQGSTRMARGGAWQREVNAMPATVLRVKRDRKRAMRYGPQAMYLHLQRPSGHPPGSSLLLWASHSWWTKFTI